MDYRSNPRGSSFYSLPPKDNLGVFFLTRLEAIYII